MARCSICHTILRPEEEKAACAACGQEYHRPCWDEVGGCATYGCAGAPPSEKAPLPAAVGGGWGDEKECPACKTVIGSSLLACPRCRARFPWADPMTREEYRKWVDGKRSLSRTCGLLVVLFILSLPGIIAPLTGVAAGLLAYARRKTLAGPLGTYLALGYGTAALGATYLVIFILLFLGR